MAEKPVQRQFWGINGDPRGHDSRCLVKDFIDPDDSACQELTESNYETISCGTDKGLACLQDVRGPSLLNITAREQDIPDLPTYIPYGLSRGSGYFLRETSLPWVAVTLPHIINRKTLKVVADVRSHLGVSPQTQILLLNYGGDQLMEDVWTNRKWVLPAIAKTNVDLMTSLDFSVFLDQPHLESVTNIIKNFVTYDLLQDYGAKVIPHVYWRGTKSLDRIAEWFNANPFATHMANYPGLQKTKDEWERELDGLQYIHDHLLRKVVLVISGPSRPGRIVDLMRIWPETIITNGVATQKAIHKKLLPERDGEFTSHVPFLENVTYFSDLVAKAQTTAQIQKVIPSEQSTYTIMSLNEKRPTWGENKIYIPNNTGVIWKGGDYNGKLPRN